MGEESERLHVAIVALLEDTALPMWEFEASVYTLSCASLAG